MSLKNQRVLDKAEVSWFSDDSMRLNYQMIFSDVVEIETEKKEPQKYQDVLFERDNIWKNKLRKAKQDAFKKGYELGLIEGKEHAALELDSKLESIKEVLVNSQSEWKHTQELLQPGVLDLAFEIAESIIGVPMETPEIRKSLDETLSTLFQKLDEKSKPLLLVSASDEEFVKKLKHDYAPNLPVSIKIKSSFNSGEFELDSNNETVIKDFKTQLRDFKKSLILPKWN